MTLTAAVTDRHRAALTEIPQDWVPEGLRAAVEAQAVRLDAMSALDKAIGETESDLSAALDAHQVDVEVTLALQTRLSGLEAVRARTEATAPELPAEDVAVLLSRAGSALQALALEALPTEASFRVEQRFLQAQGGTVTRLDGPVSASSRRVVEPASSLLSKDEAAVIEAWRTLCADALTWARHALRWHAEDRDVADPLDAAAGAAVMARAGQGLVSRSRLLAEAVGTAEDIRRRRGRHFTNPEPQWRPLAPNMGDVRVLERIAAGR